MVPYVDKNGARDGSVICFLAYGYGTSTIILTKAISSINGFSDQTYFGVFPSQYHFAVSYFTQNSSAGNITSHQSISNISSQNLNFSNSTSETTQALQHNKTLSKDTDKDKINDLTDECPIWTTGVTAVIMLIMKRRGTTNQKGSGVK